ncbi:MAG: acetate kinase [Erysipelotrichaceae bacterium]|nr:acetate kinase [Erysipelotrichaceae bacterium]MDD3810422.1 acetate kinase [Erysipelotrichaceae bacterium]
MAKIIAVNAGSSSLKFQLFEMDNEEVITSGVIERIGFDDAIFTIKYQDQKNKEILPIKDHQAAADLLLDTLIKKHIVSSLDEIKGVGHRVVQGGSYFDSSKIMDDYVVSKIDELKVLAPLHNPHHLTGYYAFKKAIPNAGAVAVFDTAFHQTLEKRCYIYPIPYKYYEENMVRKYGAHGTSHFYVSHRAIELMGNPEHSKVIVAHLGNGASLTAVKDGISVNTSMGFTPLAGIMMGTRSGDVDPSVIDYLVENIGLTMPEVIHMLNKESGLLGISGVSSDFRDVQQAALQGHERAKLALDIFFRRVIAYIGRYFIALGGIDAICFTAGIGENSAYARKEICDLLTEALGVEIDQEANENGQGDRLISTPNSKVKIFVIYTNEELVIARDTKKLLNL